MRKIKIGLEIHQQLSGRKLFCNCNPDDSFLRDKIDKSKIKFKVKRYLRASMGETGSYDVAALYESKKNKYFLYDYIPETSCLVELDEEPPHNISEEALITCLNISNFLNCYIFDKAQVMRKTVVDGSNTSGFQRTCLIALNGFLSLNNINNKKIGIETICIEEDSAKIIQRTSDFDEYDLSRLGIPLIEITTKPDITSAEEAKQVASYIGMVLRSTNSVRRGLGSIRQDVNISIEGMPRVEIKGFQQIKDMEVIINNEIQRQENIKKWSEQNKDKKNIIFNLIQELNNSEVILDLSHIFKDILNGFFVFALKIPNFKDLIGFELTNNYRIGSELSDYLKQNTKFKGFIHLDEIIKENKFNEKYGITREIFDKIKEITKIKENDNLIIIKTKNNNLNEIKNAFKIILERLIMLFDLNIKEVRVVDSNNNITRFLRPMPGSSRIYPETDIPIINLKEYKQKIKPIVLIEDKIKQLTDLGISNDIAHHIIKNNLDEIFYYFISNEITAKALNKKSKKGLNNILNKTLNEKIKIVVFVLYNLFNEIKTKYNYLMKNEDLEYLIHLILNNKITKEAAKSLMIESIKTNEDIKNINISKFKRLNKQELKKEMIKFINTQNLNKQIDSLKNSLKQESLKDKKKLIKDNQRLKSKILGILIGKFKNQSNVELIKETFDEIILS